MSRRHALKMAFATSIDSYQLAHSAQADMDRDFSQSLNSLYVNPFPYKP